MIRFILCAGFLLLFLICSIPVMLLALLVGLFNRKARDYICLRVVQWAFRVVEFLSGVKVKVIGEENVPKDKAVLYVGNHRSYFDIIFTYSRCPRLTGYIAKAEMKKAPLLNFWMMLLYCQFLDRQDMKKGLKTIKKATELAKSGISMCIFPEGTRNKEEGTLMDFKEGSLRIAGKSGCPIVPMALTNTAAVFENQFPKIRPVEVVIEYGKPFYITDLEGDDKKYPAAYSQRIIAEMLEKNSIK